MADPQHLMTTVLHLSILNAGIYNVLPAHCQWKFPISFVFRVFNMLWISVYICGNLPLPRKMQGSIYALQHYVLDEGSIIILANTVLLEMIIVDNSLHSYVLLCKAGMMCFREHQMDIIGVLRLLSLRTTI
jgi:hypothetical protein